MSSSCALLLSLSLSLGSASPAPYHRAVSTRVSAAQQAFDEGMALLYGFNHAGAIDAFRRAARLDPTLALADWGEALALGPHLNNPDVDDADTRAALDALSRALAKAKGAAEVERALIDAQRARFALGVDRATLDARYADAMRALHARYPRDVDVAVLFAEAVLDQHPWDTYRKDGGPQPWMAEVERALVEAMLQSPDHPGANHLYIHAVEASLTPERGIGAADRLRAWSTSSSMLPLGGGHLAHMPSHIDVRVGRWGDAVAANLRAMDDDDRYRAARQHAQADLGFYTFYTAHTPDFLAYAAMMDGQEKVARKAAAAMVDRLPAAFLDEHAAAVDGYLALPTEVLVRFGKWDEIVRAPPPNDARLLLAKALWHKARGIAYAATGDVAKARVELKALRDVEATIPEEQPFGLNAARTVAAIADKMLEGEVLFRAGQRVEGIEALRAAVALEDGLRYDEPPSWLVPTRHALAAALVQDKQLAEAERVYLEDLRINRDNGWALRGLVRVYQGLGRVDDKRAAEERLRRAWARADVSPTSSCYCLP